MCDTEQGRVSSLQVLLQVLTAFAIFDLEQGHVVVLRLVISVGAAFDMEQAMHELLLLLSAGARGRAPKEDAITNIGWTAPAFCSTILDGPLLLMSMASATCSAELSMSALWWESCCQSCMPL
jgi:hypothetical protein